VSVVGFIDSDGIRLTFDHVRAGEGRFLTKGGMPAPRAMLAALCNQYRPADHYGDEKTVSVTTLIDPVQKVRLIQRHDIYVKWDDNLWAAYGSIAHGFFEGGARPESDIVEHKLVIQREGYLIGGTFDLLEGEEDDIVDDPTATFGMQVMGGRDYKITSAYGVKAMVAEGIYKAKPEYFWQANLYHLFTQEPNVKQVVKNEAGERVLVPWPHAGRVHIRDWGLVAISRDWNARQHGVHIGPIEVVQVPLIELERVENYLGQRLAVYAASDMCDDAGLPACTPEETWHGRRCAAYCAAAGRCHQFDPTLGMTVDPD
jgi:hypothetical protein